MSAVVLLIPLLPLAAAALIAVLRLERTAGWMAAGGSAGALLLVAAHGPEQRNVAVPWLRIGDLDVSAALSVDGLSWWMAVLVAAICLIVIAYSITYATDAPARFFAWMAFFTAAMLALVLAGSFIVLFAAWEGVGLASFWLIAHHVEDAEARRAARKAFLMTRFGDVGLLLAWLLVLTLTGSSDIGAFMGAGSPPGAAWIAGLLLVAAIGKSAQLPLTAWLPSAMVGPTPVSALLHSATMVAAGVYLILRFFPLFEAAPGVLAVLLWIGAATALAAALVATAQMDLKRVLAWSTVSQLGEMMMALGLAGPAGAAFHLTTHAVYKSALFLSAGCVKRQTGTLELDALGGLARSMPWTAAGFGVCALALAGLPPFAGYWSEEKILAAAQAHGDGWPAFMLVLIVLAGLYIGRAFAATFRGKARSSGRAAGEEAGLLIPVLVLAFGACVAGVLLRAPIERMLPFETAAGHPGMWRWAAVAASAAGLALGGLVSPRIRFPLLIAAAIEQVPRLAASITIGFGAAASAAETIFASSATWTARAVPRLAAGTARADALLDAAVLAVAAAAVKSADATRRAEDSGFRAGVDRFAASFQTAGSALGRLQTGKVYRYTMSLFVWVALAVAAAAALALL